MTPDDEPEPEPRAALARGPEHLLELDADELRKLGRDVWAVACNYCEPTKIARDGARAFIGYAGAGSGFSELDVIVRSRGGRHVKKYERCRKLTNFRATCVPVGHPMRDRGDVWLFPTRGAAEAHAEELMTVSRRDATALRARPP